MEGWISQQVSRKILLESIYIKIYLFSIKYIE